jgi:hypothetical protein
MTLEFIGGLVVTNFDQVAMGGIEGWKKAVSRPLFSALLTGPRQKLHRPIQLCILAE